MPLGNGFTSGGGGSFTQIGNVAPQHDRYPELSAADPDGYRTSTGTTTSTATISTWNGASGSGLTEPRSFTLTLAASAGAYSLSAWTLTYEDIDGIQRTAIATPPDANGGVTLTFQLAGNVVCGVQPVSLARPAQATNSGSFTLGYGDHLGLVGGPAINATGVSFPMILSFYVDGTPTAVDTGLVPSNATTSPPNGCFLPTDLPDGSRSYDIVYLLTTES